MEKEQIIKALECCCKSSCSAENNADCPLINDEACACTLPKNALSLILEQEKRIEELTEENKRYRETVGSLVVKDGEVVGITVDKEVRYIEKGIADVFKNMAVTKAKANTVQKYREKLYREFASLSSKDKFNKEFFLTKVDKIAEKLTEDVK